jgi:ABC-type bacteriocin/lantibiotic exporter with double-glycine peptidase domain
MELKVLEAKALPVIEGPAILIQNGNFGWKRDDKPVLQEINLEVATSKLTMLIGQVGCGKTTLLKAMLGETPIAEGRVVLSSRNIAFCDQTPWLTNSTLQQNITAFSKYDPKWYASVVRACALEEDIAQLANNDQCMIGSKGIALSGGQKQRVVSLKYTSLFLILIDR